MKDKNVSSVLRSFLAVLLILTMALSMSVYAFADEPVADGAVAENAAGNAGGTANGGAGAGASSEEASVSVVGFHRDGRYVDYYAEHQNEDKKMPEVFLTADQITAATAPYEISASYEGRDQVLVMKDVGALTYTINVAQTGMYALELDYLALLGDGNGKNYELAVYIDGALPHNDSDRFILKRNWKDEDEERIQDDVGNDLYSKQVESLKWLLKDVRDPDGVFDDAAKFYLTAGTHTITLKLISGILALDTIRFHNEGKTISYNDYIAAMDAQGAKDVDADFVLEMEDYDDKSESLIQPAHDRSDPKVTPYSISKTRMNVVGGENWNSNGQCINWTIDVPATGYYTIGFRFRQSYVEDSISYRKIMIDGKVPFDEANQVAFNYGSGFQYTRASGVDDEGNKVDYKFYLTEGKHTFSMEAVIGPMANVGREAEDIVYQLNYIYRKIIIVTGTDPDTYRDYELDTYVDGLIEMLTSVLESVGEIKAEVESITGSIASATILTTLEMQLEDFIKAPYVIPDRLSVFKDNISSLSTWMLDMRDQPVQIDKAVFTGASATEARQTATFMEGLTHEVRAFWSSFVDDYTAVGSESSSGRSLTVWVGTGRDQAMVLKTLCDNYFTNETDISVNVSLVPLSILSKAIVANRGPDIALHVSRSEPMNLGVRNAVYDISQFDDFEEVSKRFTTYALTPYTLKTTDEAGNPIQKVFALPETQNFDMLFYRTDIFAELGISVPETWDDLDNILPFIQANNMTVGLDTNLGGGTFFSLILQGGNTPYRDDGAVTNFTEQYAINAFERWTRYYLQYDLPTDYSWYSRFRNGEMPLVSTSYSNITYLQNSAPELNGLWDVAPIPGTLDPETGVVNHAEESTGMSGAMIVSKTIRTSKNPEQQLADAWTFMKWWTSAEIAGEYGNRIEMAIGSVARYTTANIEAFEKIKWTTEEASVIKEQRKWVRENPELVGGYYVSRNIINAFRNVTNQHTNPREKLIYYNEQINDEIWRKRSEYHLSVPEEANK